MMGVLRSPSDFVPKLITMPRWQRDWINSHHSVNFSGLIQEIVIVLIQQNDKTYFEQNKQHLDASARYRKDFIDSVLKRHPEIIPNI